MHTVSHLHLQTPNHRWKIVQVFVLKKSMYKWIHAVQTHVVQGSTIIAQYLHVVRAMKITRNFIVLLYQFHLNNNNNTLLSIYGVCTVCYATSHGDHRAFLDRLWNGHGGCFPRSNFHLSQFLSSFSWTSVLCYIKSCSVSGYHQHFIKTLLSP